MIVFNRLFDSHEHSYGLLNVGDLRLYILIKFDQQWLHKFIEMKKCW